MKKLSLAIGVVASLLVVTACSTENVDQIVEKALQAQDNVKSYYAEITTTYEFDGETDTSSYKEWSAKPDKNRIEHDTGDLYVSNGKESWSYDKEANIVTVYDFDNEIFNEDKLDEAEFDEKEFMREMLKEMLSENDVEIVGKEKVANRKTYHLSLKPKKDDEFAMVNDIWIDTEFYMPLKMKFEGDDFSTLMEYTLIEYNIDIADDKFNFNIPNGAEVQYWSDLMPKSMTLEELKEAVTFAIPEVNDVPEGFTFTEATYYEDMDLVMLDYNDGEEGFLSISFTVNGNNDYLFEDEDSEEVQIGDITGTVTTFADITSLSWKKDDYSFDITSTVSKEELIKVASEIK